MAAPITAFEPQSYTGHEHLDDIGIIHMNGRIYDPRLGRMLSPDPVTQAPENGQNYNRYTYANNNPLRYTDPSGYSFAPACVGGTFDDPTSSGNICSGGGNDWSDAFKALGWLGEANGKVTFTGTDDGFAEIEFNKDAFLETLTLKYGDQIASTGDVSELFRVVGGKIDLTEHEGINNSHTVKYHVGKSDKFLRRRMNEYVSFLGARRYRKEASTFSSMEAANNLVSSTIWSNAAKVAEWLESGEGELVLNKTFESPTGQVAYRDGRGAYAEPGPVKFASGTGVRVVLRRNEDMPSGFNVHTAFPTL